MGLKVSIYDFFSYLIPGGFYLTTFCYLGMVMGVIPANFEFLDKLNITNIMVIGIISYIVGLILDPISRPWYYGLFSRQFQIESMQEVNSYSKLQITADPQNWGVMLWYIKNQESGNSDGIERYNVTTVMLRNVSFSFLLSGIVTIILIIKTDLYLWNIFLCLLLFCLSILAGREAARFHRWFYQAIYQSFVAYGIKPSDFLKEGTNKINVPEIKRNDL